MKKRTNKKNWVSNLPKEMADDFRKETAIVTHQGPPQATEKFSREALQKMGMVGIYRS
jgi:hypothetical protein